MPRYRFAWENLPNGLRRQLGRDLRLASPTHEALRARYGARPKPEFVRDSWPTLLDAWLPKDRAAREVLVEELQARRLGNFWAPVRSAAAQMDYLRSCRNSTSLREIAAAVLTAVGESQLVSTPVP